MAATIQRDPVLSACVMRMANSAYFAGHGRVQTVSEAAVRLGTKELRQMAIAITIVQDHQGGGNNVPLDTVNLWKHSLGCAVVARELASGGDRRAPEEAFLAGLLHDVGKNIFNEHFGSEYREVLTSAHQEGRPLHTQETDRLSLDHAEAAGPILERWRLPPTLTSPILHHHQPWTVLKALTGEGRDTRLAHLVKIADTLAKACGVGEGGDETLEAIPNEAWASSGVPAGALSKAIEQLDAKVAEMAQIILLHGGTTEVRRRPARNLAGLPVTLVRSDNRAAAVHVLLRREGCMLRVGADVERALSKDTTGPVLVGPVDADEGAELTRLASKGSRRGIRPCVFLVEGSAEAEWKERVEQTGCGLLTSPWSTQRLLQMLGSSPAVRTTS